MVSMFQFLYRYTIYSVFISEYHFILDLVIIILSFSNISDFSHDKQIEMIEGYSSEEGFEQNTSPRIFR